MKQELLIVTGEDRPGIVSAVSGVLFRAGINLEDVRMSILEGQFAMMLIVCVPDKVRQTLSSGLIRLEKSWKLSIFQCSPAHRLSHKKQPGGRKTAAYLIRVIGRDKTGIVAGVSRVLAGFRCNITDLQCRILGAGPKAIYTMILECSAPAGMKLHALQLSLKRLARRLKVEIRIDAADVFKF